MFGHCKMFCQRTIPMYCYYYYYFLYYNYNARFFFFLNVYIYVFYNVFTCRAYFVTLLC